MSKDIQEMTLRELYKSYYNSVKNIAIEALEIDDTDDRADYIHESVDGSEWVIYTHKARLVSVLSENVDACEELGDEPQKPESIAFFAMRADVERLLDNEYFIEEHAKKEETKESELS
jgi:hypothetical protein